MDFSNEAIAALTWNKDKDHYYVGEDSLYLYVGKRARTWYCVNKYKGKCFQSLIGEWPGIDFAEARRRARIYRTLIKKGISTEEISAAFQGAPDDPGLWLVRLVDGSCRVVFDRKEFAELGKSRQVLESVDMGGLDTETVEGLSRMISLAAWTRKSGGEMD